MAEHSDGVEESLNDSHSTKSILSSNSDSTDPLSRIGLKAGMQGLDKTKVNQIILEASKGSKFHVSELRKDEQVTKRIEAMMERLRKLTDAQKATALKITDRQIELLERTRDLSHVIVHVDMDAFYAAVEMRDNPRLKEVPMAVGSTGMLSTSNYLARSFGVRAAMPGFIGKKLCPNLVIIEPNYKKYRQVGSEVRDVLASYDPNFCSVGLDEAYLDLTKVVTNRSPGSTCVASQESVDCVEQDDVIGTSVHDDDGASEESGLLHLSSSHWKHAEMVVAEIRREICKKTGLTASAGIAPNKMLAKVASDVNKPNGQYLVDPSRDGLLKFVWSLPIRKIGGIGKVTERMLNALGVTTCADLYEKRAILHLLFSQVSVQSFLCICLGIGSTAVYSEYERKSISTERTFSETSGHEELQRKCRELCESLGEDVLNKRVMGHTVTLKIKTANFEVKTRSCTLPHLVSTADELYHAASELLRLELLEKKTLSLRLMGVRLSSLEDSNLTHKQGTLKELFRKCTGSGTALVTSEVYQEKTKTDVGVDACSSMATCRSTCPICSQLVPSENAAFNRHIDECLNYSAIQESLTAEPTSTMEASLSSQLPPTLDLDMQGHYSPSQMYSSRKRKTLDDGTAHAPKRRTLDYYFRKQNIMPK